MIREEGIEKNVIEYMKKKIKREMMVELMRKMDIQKREMMREKEERYEEMGIDDNEIYDEVMIEEMIRKKVMMKRKVVVKKKGVSI